MQPAPELLAFLPLFLQSLNENPTAAVVLVALAAFYVLHKRN